MTLNKLVVHKIEKEAQGISNLILGHSLLTVRTRESEFIINVRQVYYNKSNPNYGIFNDNTVSYPFQSLLRAYLDSSVNFLRFTKNAMNHLKEIMNGVTQSTGGYVLFAHYTSNNENFLLIVMLNNKRQYNINDSLSIDEIFSLDIDKLDVASTINISRWNNNEDTYLSFTPGRKGISQYFKRFVGCTEQTSAKQSSSSLKRALLDYFEILNEDDDVKENLKNQVYSYCMQQTNNKVDISLSHISSIISPGDPNLFKEFASDEDYRVNPWVKAHKQTLKSLKYYIYKSKELSIEFDSSLINDSIFYSEANNELRICNVPENLKNQLLNIDVEQTN